MYIPNFNFLGQFGGGGKIEQEQPFLKSNPSRFLLQDISEDIGNYNDKKIKQQKN